MTRPDLSVLPPRRTGLQPRNIVLLAVIWMLLWGDLSIFALLSGLFVGLIVTVSFPMPPVRFAGRIRPLRLIALVGHLLVDLVRASIGVVATIFRPGPPVRSGIIGVDLRGDSDLYEALTSELLSLVPGTLVIEARRSTRTLYLHVLEVRGPEELAAARASVRRAEDQVLATLASREEIDAAREKP